MIHTERQSICQPEQAGIEKATSRKQHAPPSTCEAEVEVGTMRFGSIANILVKCMVNFKRISW